MSDYLKVENENSLVRDMTSHAIINTNQSDYEKFLSLSKKKAQERQEYNDLKSDVKSLKDDMSEIKSLLKSIVDK
jgi:hypothetical protein|tara:strand:+ start:2063 stop:2287 length:225 start_codon:yes stop_codon:yes gene_type:complete